MPAQSLSRPLNGRERSQLLRFGAATIYEANDKKGAMDGAIGPIDTAFRLCGRAFTVDCAPGDNLILHHAVTLARPGDVLVVDAKGFIGAGHWGDLITLAAQRRGIAGLVIDGAVRDAGAIARMGFPVFARGLSIRTSGKSCSGRVGVDLVCGGVVVRPGDIVVGDRDGVVVVGAAEFSTVLRAAAAREKKEAHFRQALARGKTTVELFGLGPKLREMGLSDPPR